MHRPGKNHTNADCLSRVPCKQCGLSEALDDAVSCDVVQMEAILPTWSPEDLKSAQRNDPDFMEVISWFESNSIPRSPVQAKLKTLWFQKDQLILKEGVLYRQWEDVPGGGLHRGLQLVLLVSLVPEVLSARTT